MSHGSRSAQSAATEYAMKRREQIARAAELRKERDEMKVTQQRQEDLGDISSRRSSAGTIAYSEGQLVRASPATRSTTIPSNVEITSYGDFCERIVIRNPEHQQSFAQIESVKSSASVTTTNSASSGRVTSRRQQEVLAKARAAAAASMGGGPGSDGIDELTNEMSITGLSSRAMNSGPISTSSASKAATSCARVVSSSSSYGPSSTSSSRKGGSSASMVAAEQEEIDYGESPIYSQCMSLHGYYANSNTFTCAPVDPSGRLYDLSDRPLMCASTNMRNEVVFGGSDHALYAIDISDPRKQQVQLYSKKFGHTDWVTSCAHLRDGRLLSASMDCRLLLWSLDRRSCVDLSGGHDKSISKIVTDMRYNIALSCGYDCRAAVWSFAGGSGGVGSGGSASSSSAIRGRGIAGRSAAGGGSLSPTNYLVGASDPVLDCTFMDNIAALVCRDGSILLYDMTSCECVRQYKGHSGQITSLDAFRCDASNGGEGQAATGCFATGAMDGYVKVWDARVRTGAVLESRPHVGKAPATSAPPSTSKAVSKGSSAVTNKGNSKSEATLMRAATVSCLCNLSSRGSGNGASTYLVSGGSDNKIFVMDLRQSMQSVAMYDHSKIGMYSLCVAGDTCVFAGDGSGMMYCYDTAVSVGEKDPYYEIGSSQGALKYGIQASSAGAVRSIICVGGKIVIGGEDGKAIVFSY